MSESPYRPPTPADPPRTTRRNSWALALGFACLAISAVCAVLTVGGLANTFQTAAEATSTPPAKELAEGISYALLPAYGVVPFGLLGIVLLIVGLLTGRTAIPGPRRPPS